MGEIIIEYIYEKDIYMEGHIHGGNIYTEKHTYRGEPQRSFRTGFSNTQRVS